MKTYIIPIDFSETSAHAAEYAALLSNQTEVERIVLLHSYHVSVYESVLPTPDMILPSEEEIDENIIQKTHQLEQIAATICTQTRRGVVIQVIVSRSALIRAILETVNDENADLLILGSNGNSSKNVSHVGSNVVNIAKLSPVPVIVVPPGCCYEQIKRVTMACDFYQVKNATPLSPLKSLLSRHHLEVLVVNINKAPKPAGVDAEEIAKETALYSVLEEYHPEYYNNSGGAIITGILNFAKDHKAQLVIALPHKYSFFQSLLHHSLSHQLTIQSEVPVLLLK